MTARSFFLSDLPRMLVAEPRRFADLRGVVAVSVQGGGKFTIRLGDLENPVAEGFDQKASVKLWFLGDTFERFLQGPLPSSMTTRELILQGDGDVLESFGRFLSETAAVMWLEKKKKRP